MIEKKELATSSRALLFPFSVEGPRKGFSPLFYTHIHLLSTPPPAGPWVV